MAKSDISSARGACRAISGGIVVGAVAALLLGYAMQVSPVAWWHVSLPILASGAAAITSSRLWRSTASKGHAWVAPVTLLSVLPVFLFATALRALLASGIPLSVASLSEGFYLIPESPELLYSMIAALGADAELAWKLACLFVVCEVVFVCALAAAQGLALARRLACTSCNRVSAVAAVLSWEASELATVEEAVRRRSWHKLPASPERGSLNGDLVLLKAMECGHCSDSHTMAIEMMRGGDSRLVRGNIEISADDFRTLKYREKGADFHQEVAGVKLPAPYQSIQSELRPRPRTPFEGIVEACPRFAQA